MNNEDAFVADWGRENVQDKYYMSFCCYRNEWVITHVINRKPTGVVVMSEESAIYLQAKLNKGLITGVNANGDI